MSFPAKLIKADGSEVRDVEIPDGSIMTCCELIGCDVFNVVRTVDGVLLVDDGGLRKGLPRNELASSMYGGTIVGDAVWFTLEGFAAFDASVEF
jgi:hypothetical protein